MIRYTDKQNWQKNSSWQLSVAEIYSLKLVVLHLAIRQGSDHFNYRLRVNTLIPNENASSWALHSLTGNLINPMVARNICPPHWKNVTDSYLLVYYA